MVEVLHCSSSMLATEQHSESGSSNLHLCDRLILYGGATSVFLYGEATMHAALHPGFRLWIQPWPPKTLKSPKAPKMATVGPHISFPVTFAGVRRRNCRAVLPPQETINVRYLLGLLVTSET